MASIVVLSRLYELEDFGVWATFMAILMIGKTIACGGFHVCLMLPEEDAKAKDMLAISYRFNWITILINLAAILLLIYFAPSVVHKESILLFIVALPYAIFLEGKAQAAHSWLNRANKYKEMSYGMVAQTLTTVVFQILFGWIGVHDGLILGTVLGQTMLLIAMLRLANLPFFLSAPAHRLVTAFKEYKSFLTMGVTGNLVNNSASQLPYVFFPSFFGEAMTGQLSMVQQRVLAAPINLVSAAVSPVFFKEANTAHLANDGSLSKLVLRVNYIMWSMIIIPVLAIVFFGPEIFAFVLGEKWRVAGEYAQWLAPVMGVRFVTHPLAYLVDIKHRLRAQLIYNSILLLVTIVLFYEPILQLSAFDTIKAYGITFFSLQMCFLGYMLHLRKD